VLSVLVASCLGFPARRFRLRAEKPPLRSRRPVSPRSLRLRSAVRRKTSSFAFPTLRVAAPAANAASLWTRVRRLAFHAAFAGWHPAAALRHAATSMSLVPCSGSLQAGGVVREDCERTFLSSLRSHGFTPRGAVEHPAEESGGHACPPKRKKATSRWPRLKRSFFPLRCRCWIYSF